MSNPDSGFPALRGGIAKAVFGERYFRMIFWAALRAVSGCAIREKYSGSDFPRAILPGDIRGLYLERYSGRHFLCDIQGGVAGRYPIALFGRSIPGAIFRGDSAFRVGSGWDRSVLIDRDRETRGFRKKGSDDLFQQAVLLCCQKRDGLATRVLTDRVGCFSGAGYTRDVAVLLRRSGKSSR